jgi:hypothetical protein
MHTMSNAFYCYSWKNIEESMKKHSDYFYFTLICGLLIAGLVFACGKTFKSISSETEKFETRCGWFDNPTPSNISLYDRDNEWIIGVQGGHQVEKEWDWPVFVPKQWIRTNNNYGYGCVCMQIKINRKTHEVLEIKDAQAQSLAVCRQDQVLDKWKTMFK